MLSTYVFILLLTLSGFYVSTIAAYNNNQYSRYDNNYSERVNRANARARERDDFSPRQSINSIIDIAENPVVMAGIGYFKPHVGVGLQLAKDTGFLNKIRQMF